MGVSYSATLILLTRIAYALIGLSTLFIDTPACLISISTIIAAGCHIRWNTVTDFNPIKKSLLRFSVILLCIDFLILAANIVVTLAFVLQSDADIAVFIG